MQLEAIIFDLGNTLMTQYVEERIVIRKALKNIGEAIPLSKNENIVNELIRAYDDIYKEIDYLRETYYVEIPMESWLSKLLIKIKKDSLSESALNKAKKIFIEARTSFVKAFYKVPEVLRELKTKYPLGIVSNTSSSEVTFQVLSKFKIMHLFDTIVTSADFGVRKPYPGIFLHALKELRIKNIHSTVFVGDLPIHDIKGAKNVGMKTILVSGNRIQRDVKGSDIAIKEVKDLPKALEHLL